MAKYIYPFTNFGFEKLFGEESSKNILISFLNALLMPESPIKNIIFKNPFKLDETKSDLYLVFDLFCEKENGEKFFVELQKAEQEYYNDSLKYYSTFPIQEQTPKGKWSKELKAVYCIGILDFELEYIKNKDYVNVMQIKNQNNKVFSDKFCLVTIEMPKFKKKGKELKTLLDKWLFFIKNLENFEKLPKLFNEKIFKEATKKTDVANFSKEEVQEYESSLKSFRDWYSILETESKKGYAGGFASGIAKGFAEGLAKGIAKGIAKRIEENRIAGSEIGIKKGLIKGKQEGLQKGILETRKEFILNLHKKGYTSEQIADLLNFELNIVKKIIASS